jgi:hypothetical protein
MRTSRFVEEQISRCPSITTLAQPLSDNGVDVVRAGYPLRPAASKMRSAISCG